MEEEREARLESLFEADLEVRAALGMHKLPFVPRRTRHTLPENEVW